MHAPPKSDIPVVDAKTLESYDAFLFGIPTRYGNFPAQWKAFWDSTGGQWGTGGYWGKYAGVFVSSASPGGGQESTAIAALSTLSHHGSESISSAFIFLTAAGMGTLSGFSRRLNLSSYLHY
jgi:NAD(P)H dehydrogenase (quinone)